MITLDPIAYFHSSYLEKADIPRQGSLGEDQTGTICFLPGKNFEQALEDLKGIEKIWVIFWMHKVKNWKTKIQPPRNTSKKGVFATRSPHRPNPIGLSVVTLLSIKGRKLEIKNHDLLDQTPILDIKPYLPYADSFPDVKTGWIAESGLLEANQIFWSQLAISQKEYIYDHMKEDLFSKISDRLKYFTHPSSSNRVHHLRENYYVLGCKTWRIVFQKNDQIINVLFVFSGFVLENLERERFHREFMRKFEPFFPKYLLERIGLCIVFLGQEEEENNGKDF